MRYHLLNLSSKRDFYSNSLTYEFFLLIKTLKTLQKSDLFNKKLLTTFTQLEVLTVIFVVKSKNP